MKTPHTIELLTNGSEPVFNPATGKYEPNKGESVFFPCLANFMTKAKQFEEYGSREHEIIVVRFNSEVPDFYKAKYEGNTYKPLEQSFSPRKKSYRLQKVAD